MSDSRPAAVPSSGAADTSEAAEPMITVVAVHGNGGGAHRFSLATPQMPSGVRLHAVTLPGFAAVPSDPSLQTLRDYAVHLAHLVAAQPRPRVLLGHGIGGSIALEMVQEKEPAIDGLILHAPVGANLDTRWFPWLMSLPGARELGKQVFAIPILRPFFRWMLFSGAVPRSFSDQFFDEYATCAVFGQMFDLVTPEWFWTLRPTQVPSAILWGAAERVLTVDQVAEFTKLLPDALVARIVGWGHFPMAEAPRSYADEVARLARVLVAQSQSLTAEAEAAAADAKAKADAAAVDAELAEVARHNATLSSWTKPT